jgi:hypothetical protein
LWFTTRQKLPPLVTSGPLKDPVPGALGDPKTQVLVSGVTGDRNEQSGVRLNFGVGLDNSCDWSVLGSAFLLDQRSGSRVVSSNGDPTTNVIARPFYNVVAHQQDADPVAVPGIASGSIRIDTPRVLYGADVNARYHYLLEPDSRLIFLAGVRFLALDEGLNITETSSDLPGLGAPGNNYFLAERYKTQNRFYGVQVGSEYSYRFGRVSFDGIGKVAVGAMQKTLINSAVIRIDEPNGIVETNTNNALYISPNNAGRFHHTTLAVVPEGALRMNFDFNEYIRFSVGYSVLYLSSVIRPGDQVDRNVTVQPVGVAPFYFPPPAHVPTLTPSVFWAHGLDVGLRFSF